MHLAQEAHGRGGLTAAAASASSATSSFVVDGLSLRPELDGAAARFQRHYNRRPDKHPFIVDVHSSIFFSTRAMPQTNTRYPTVVGESFWRLAAYIDSVPPQVEDRIPGKAPHVLVRGMPGCGKSYLMAATSALLASGSSTGRPRLVQYLSADYRTVFIGDCRRWLDSDDPLTYFRMELLGGFRDMVGGDPALIEDHYREDHLGCMICVEPFTRVEQVRHFMEKCCRWLSEHQPDSMFVFFIDQVEELIGRPDSIPYQVIQQLLALQTPLLVFAITESSAGSSGSTARALEHSNFPFKEHCSAVVDVPFRATAAEFAKHIEVHTGVGEEERFMAAAAAAVTAQSPPPHGLPGPAVPPGNPTQQPQLYKEVSWWKDMRLWCGSIPHEIAELVRIPGASVPARLQKYQRMAATRINATLLPAIARLDGKQRNVLLIVLFAVILRVPVDMSGEFNLSSILALGPAITNHLLLNCIQAFYHTSDGIITMRDVPAATSMAVHLVLCSPSTLTAVIRTWPTLFENVVHAMMASKLLCAEAKRRMSRFYVHAKLLWGRQDWCLEHGATEMGEALTIKFRQPRVVLFAGQTPMAAYLTTPTDSNGGRLEAEHHGQPLEGGDYDATVFIPARTSYWFFDLFVLIPAERRLYAITTSAVVGTWLKELQTRTGPMQLQAQRDDGLLTPIILLENWREMLKKAGLNKITIKCCVLKTADLMAGAGYSPPPPATLTPSAVPAPGTAAPDLAPPGLEVCVQRLAAHLESASLNAHDHR